MISLLLSLLSFSLFAQDNRSWIDQEWAKLPETARATKPSPGVPISQEDREGLTLDVTPVARNTYLKKTYSRLAHAFYQCLGVPMGSWYHFAYFANRTSGEFMTGQRFKEMGWLERHILELMGWHDLIPSEKEMIELFAYVNFTIGIEMVPHGKLFLESFCGKETIPAFEVFSSKLEDNDLARRELLSGYKAYHDALFENDPTLRLERVALGTSLLMMGEQRRAQSNVDALFRFGNDERGPVEFFYRWTAAATTGLELNEDVVVPFATNMTAKYIKNLRVTLPRYIELHQEHKLKVNPVRGEFPKTRIFDWGNIDQRLRFMLAVVRGHSERSALIKIEKE